MSVLSNLEKGLMRLSDVSYDSIDKLMRKLAKDHRITPRELHDRFKAKHNMIPDDWAKKQMKINEEGLRDWFGKSKSKDGKPGWVQSDGSPCANEPGETGTPKCYSSAKKASMSKKELRSADTRKSRQDPGQQSKSGAAKPTYVSTDKPKKKMKEETFNEAEDKKTKGSGTKDACYSKVKSRYSVWPSAYASGALVKCRKVGAANWGNSTKKEEFEGFYDLPAFTESQIAAMKYAGIEVEVIDEACWKGYEKKGMKTMFGKRYPNCVKKTKKEEVELIDEKKGCMHNHKGEECPVHGNKECPDMVKEAVRIPSKTGNIIAVVLNWRGKGYMIKMFFPSVKVPSRKEIQSSIETVYPGAKVQSYQVSEYEPGQPVLHAEAAAWTKKSGKNKEGGLNEKGRKSYERDNPGSNLKAPSKKVGNPRRASFCARMKGMKKKLTSAKTARDPDSRINKSLRAWNC